MKRWICTSCLMLLSIGTVNAALFRLPTTNYFSNFWQTYPVMTGWFVQGSLGASFPDLGKNNYAFAVFHRLTYQYGINKVNTAPLFSIGAGYRWETLHKWFPYYSLGLKFSYAPLTKIHGTLHVFTATDSIRYQYRESFRQQIIMGVFKGNIYQLYNVLPYITFGVGGSINQARGYRDFPPDNIAVPSPAFNNKKLSHISVMLGAGIDFIVRPDINASLEYNWGDYGFIRTGQGINYNPIFNFSSSSLRNRFNSSQAMLTINYFLGIC